MSHLTPIYQTSYNDQTSYNGMSLYMNDAKAIIKVASSPYFFNKN